MLPIFNYRAGPLFMSYCRWDANGGPYKSRPHLLKGGFHNFVMHYPTEVVNPHTAREYVPKKRNNSTGVKVGFYTTVVNRF